MRIILHDNSNARQLLNKTFHRNEGRWFAAFVCEKGARRLGRCLWQFVIAKFLISSNDFMEIVTIRRYREIDESGALSSP